MRKITFKYFEAEDESVDDGCEVLIDGVKTNRFEIQYSAMGKVLNEYEFDKDGKLIGAIYRGKVPTPKKAIELINKLLDKSPMQEAGYTMPNGTKPEDHGYKLVGRYDHLYKPGMTAKEKQAVRAKARRA